MAVFTEATESMHFHERFHAEYLQNTHMAHTMSAAPYSECWEREVTTAARLTVFPLNISGPTISSPLNINANIQLWGPILFQKEINTLCGSVAFQLHHVLCDERKLWGWRFFFFFGRMFLCLTHSVLRAQRSTTTGKSSHAKTPEQARLWWCALPFQNLQLKYNLSNVKCVRLELYRLFDRVFAFRPRFCVYYWRIPLESTPVKSLRLSVELPTFVYSRTFFVRYGRRDKGTWPEDGRHDAGCAWLYKMMMVML